MTSIMPDARSPDEARRRAYDREGSIAWYNHWKNNIAPTAPKSPYSTFGTRPDGQSWERPPTQGDPKYADYNKWLTQQVAREEQQRKQFMSQWTAQNSYDPSRWSVDPSVGGQGYTAKRAQPETPPSVPRQGGWPNNPGRAQPVPPPSQGIPWWDAPFAVFKTSPDQPTQPAASPANGFISPGGSSFGRPSGQQPWGAFGQPAGMLANGSAPGTRDTPGPGGWGQQGGYSPYTNSQGEGFMGSMSFAPNTPVSYQNQAYGKFANSQGYFQQPQENLPTFFQKQPTFRQGQAQPVQPPSQGTPLSAPAVKPPSPAWSAPPAQSQPQRTSYGQSPWGGQRMQVGTNMSQPMSRWSFG